MRRIAKLILKAVIFFLFSAPALAVSVIEFYNSNLDNYFITADPGEAAAIDSGGAGPGWGRTGNSFTSGGSASVCRFYGSQSPGPNSHFYTVDAGECASLKYQQSITPVTQKRWNFESLDFASTPPTNGACPGGTQPVYRAYNNGFSRGIDSNHRITTSLTAIQQEVSRGWSNEGVVMCAPTTVATTLACTGAHKSGSNVLQFGTSSYSYLSSTPNISDTFSLTINNLSYSDNQLSSLSRTGSLRFQLWAVSSSYSGGTITGYVLGKYVMAFSDGTDFLRNGESVSIMNLTTSGTNPPSGEYCVVATLEEFQSSGTYAIADWAQYSNTQKW